jgi:hypothetical protein
VPEGALRAARSSEHHGVEGLLALDAERLSLQRPPTESLST